MLAESSALFPVSDIYFPVSDCYWSVVNLVRLLEASLGRVSQQCWMCGFHCLFMMPRGSRYLIIKELRLQDHN